MFYEYSLNKLEKLLREKSLSARELLDYTFKRINKVERKIQAFLTLDEENAYKKAKLLDEHKTKKDHRLYAIPYGVKDNIITKGIRTTCASKFLNVYGPPARDAAVIRKINHENAIMIGKLNMDEFAMGSSSEHSGCHITHNPWNTNYVPGGSSGGSAAAVASGQVKFALGTDTGGSIRQPASFCGVVGMKPTYGLVSQNGLIEFAPSLDQIGPITLTVEDNARVLEVMANVNDATNCLEKNQIYTKSLKNGIKGLKIGIPKEFLNDYVSSEVKEAIIKSLKIYESLGAKIEEISLPYLKYADIVYYLISTAEASKTLLNFNGAKYSMRKRTNQVDISTVGKESLGKEVKRRLVIGKTILDSEYHEDYFVKAQKVRNIIKNDFDRVFLKYDVIIGPSIPKPAFKFNTESEEVFEIYMKENILTVPANLVGLPSISLPCGISKKGLPIGLQIIGKHFDEKTVYNVAYKLEKSINFLKKYKHLKCI